MTVPASTAATSLRCHRCSHFLTVAASAMQLVGIFKPSLIARVPKSHTDEVRQRCRSCGWVNVFHPMSNAPPVEVKQ